MCSYFPHAAKAAIITAKALVAEMDMDDDFIEDQEQKQEKNHHSVNEKCVGLGPIYFCQAYRM